MQDLDSCLVALDVKLLGSYIVEVTTTRLFRAFTTYWALFVMSSTFVFVMPYTAKLADTAIGFQARGRPVTLTVLS